MMTVDEMLPVYYHNKMVEIKEELSDCGSKIGTIHSGHFMVSRVHDVNKDEEEDDDQQDTSPFTDHSKGFDFLTASRETMTTYNFSHANNQSVGIDASLTKLFECMTLAYSGKITSPKWKQFRGLHLSQKQRIRLNNLIWREWHLQYIYGKRPMVCQFATPLSDHIHSKPEAVVLEGKYWKRQLDAVTAEYKKWRRYFKERMRHQQGFSYQENRTLSEWELLERVKELTFISHKAGSYVSSTDLNLLNADIMDMDLTNELFASLNQPFAFPNPRELSQLGCADLIQPGLVQLQPNLEEFMDIDSMQELFNIRMPSFYSAFTTDSTSAGDLSMAALQSTDMTLENFLRDSSPIVASIGSLAPADTINSSPSTVLCGNNTASFLPDSTELPQNITFQLAEDGQYNLDPTTILLGATLSQGSTKSLTLSQGSTKNLTLSHGSPHTLTFVPGGLYSPISVGASHRTSTATSSSELLAQLIEHQQQSLEVMLAPTKLFSQQTSIPIQPARSLNQQPQQQQMFRPTTSPQNPLLSQSLSFQHQQQPQTVQPNQKRQNLQTNHLRVSDTVNRSTLGSGVLKELASSAVRRKDGPFTLPMSKSVVAQRKPQVTTPSKPATPPQQPAVIQSPSSQASYLAELLKNGTYPGALVHVKKEPQFPVVTSSSPIKTTTNFYQHMSPIYNSTFEHNMPGAVGATTHPTNYPVLSDTGLDDASDFETVAALSSGLVSFDVPLSVISQPSSRYSLGSESKLRSSASLMPNSPVASPPIVKRTSSQVQPMDMGLDRVFSPAIPLSPPTNTIFEGALDSSGSEESTFPKENRRTSQMSAEQKRRCNLKTGFDLLQQLVPALSQNPKVSKATMLQKTAEYCKKLKAERAQMQKESTILKEEIDALNSAISIVQSQLPETGVPVTRQRKDQMTEMFDEYVRVRTNENSKFWIFSMLMSSLYDSYCNAVSTSSMEDLCRTSITWLNQSCSLVTLRPNVLNALRKLCTSTPILTDPQRMKQHALQVVARKGKGQRSNNMMIK